MKLLISEEQLKEYKNTDKVPLECKQCNKIFLKDVFIIKGILNGTREATGEFCSITCCAINRKNKIEVMCKQCSKLFLKLPSQIKKHPNNFCSSSCAAIYNNKNKTTGFRKSSWEDYLVELIKEDFPDIKIEQSVRNLLPSGLEIDIFLPELNLAIELNGLTHYFPIYGQEKFLKIQNNDSIKQLEIQQHGINLIVSNITHLKNYINKYKIIFKDEYETKIKPFIEISL
jgi:hypothetical protein